ncbi:MAG: hypothetical protein KC613_02225, partial [Myxococcales bacterium]|nr:hypothetical protein [Myxococcales bacterium]
MGRCLAGALAVALLTGGLLGGCNTGRDPDLEGLALAWADQATAERWRYARFVTRCDGKTLADCRLAPPWRSQRLFKSGGTLPEPDASGPTYWLHEWVNEQTPDDAARAIMNAGNDLPLRPPRVQPMADLDALRGAMSQAWKGPAGAVSGRIAGEAVRVAVLDTVPHGMTRVDAAEGVSPHGLDMARAVQQGACGASVSCPVRVVTELALDLVPGRVGGSRRGDPALGGAYGDPGSLAVAIHKATERWLAEDDSSRLVLVIPAGWTPMAADPGAEAVLLALQQARCFGAVTVAAFGNAGDGAADAGRVPRGPLCPACFADEAVPGCASSRGPVWPVAGAQLLPDGSLGRLPNGRDPGTIAPAAYG